MQYQPDICLRNVMNNTVLDVYKPTFRNQNRYCIYYGGAGSGKSRFIAQKILYRIVYEQNHRFLIVRKVKDTLRASVFQLIKDYINGWGIADRFRITESTMKITHKASGNTIMFMGIDKSEKLKSIEKISSVWIEEASELEEGDFNELDRRLRGKHKNYKQIIMSFNPISHLHWLKKRFFDNPPEDVFILKTTYLDNPKLEPEDIKVLIDMKNYDIQQYNIYALAEWGVLNTNVVYHNYDFMKHSTTLTVNDFDVLHVGIDFNIGGCVGVVVGIRGPKAYAVHGFAVHDTDAVVTELMKLRGKEIILYPDASGSKRTTNSSKSDIAILTGAGYRINAPKANGAIRDRVNAVNRMFALDLLYINEKMERLSHSLQTQTYTDSGLPEKFTDHKGGAVDDWNDSLGYMIVRMFGLVKAATVEKIKLSYA